MAIWRYWLWKVFVNKPWCACHCMTVFLKWTYCWQQMADLHHDMGWYWCMVDLKGSIALRKLIHCWWRCKLQPSIKEDRDQWREKGEIYLTTQRKDWMCDKDVCDPLCFLLYISCSRAEPRALSATLSKLTGPPSWVCMGMCVLGHTHVCMCVYVCARTNLKQVSVISPAEAQAQRELIIHTVTLFTVALILQSLLLPAFFQSPEA